MAFASWSTKLKRFIGLDPPSCDSCVPRARGPRRRNGVPGAGDCCSACFSVCCCCCACGFGVKVGETSLFFRILSNFGKVVTFGSQFADSDIGRATTVRPMRRKEGCGKWKVKEARAGGKVVDAAGKSGHSG